MQRRDGMASASLPAPGASDALFLVDLSGYVFRAYHALPRLSSSRGEPTHAVLGTVNMLQKVVGERRPHMLAVAMDSRGPTFRHAVDVRYKATRPAPPPDLSQQMARVEQIIRAWDVACFRADNLEGIYAAVDPVAKPKLRENLRAHEADARVSQKVVSLDAGAPLDWQRTKLLWGGADVAALRSLYADLEFKRQLDQLDALANGAF